MTNPSDTAVASELEALLPATHPAGLAFPAQRPQVSGNIRVQPEDFCVDELPQATPSGEGEHAWLHIRKTGANTAWVAKQLAAFAGVNPRDVSYAGLKDRHAVTTQWFSVWLPGRADPDWSASQIEGAEILQATRHSKKLRRGELKGNRFNLRVTGLRGDADQLALIPAALDAIAEQGVPNYFGVQRFGHDASNLKRFAGLSQGQRIDRQQRGLILSAVRSALFNHFLNQQVVTGNWNHCDDDAIPLSDRDGDLDGFTALVDDDALNRPTGVLWGEGRGRLSRTEEAFFAAYPALCGALLELDLRRHRRSLWLPVVDLAYELDSDNLQLSFSLPPGAFATTVLDAIADIN